MLKMRLQRVGRVHEPSFRLVLTDSKNSTKSGRFKEVLGSYDPRKSTDSLKKDRIEHWLSKGVGVTGTVHNLLVTHKIIDAKKMNVAKIVKTTPKQEENTLAEENPVTAEENPVTPESKNDIIEEVNAEPAA